MLCQNKLPRKRENFYCKAQGIKLLRNCLVSGHGALELDAGALV